MSGWKSETGFARTVSTVPICASLGMAVKNAPHFFISTQHYSPVPRTVTVSRSPSWSLWVRAGTTDHRSTKGQGQNHNSVPFLLPFPGCSCSQFFFGRKAARRSNHIFIKHRILFFSGGRGSIKYGHFQPRNHKLC